MFHPFALCSVGLWGEAPDSPEKPSLQCAGTENANFPLMKGTKNTNLPVMKRTIPVADDDVRAGLCRRHNRILKPTGSRNSNDSVDP
jgi:hypothetical protein